MTDAKDQVQKFGHAFNFKLGKYSLVGAALGVVSAVLTEVIEKKGKVINKWLINMRRAGLLVDSLDSEVELCKMFYLIHQNYVKDNEELKYQFDIALNQTCESSFLADKIEQGLLNTFIPKIESGDIDARYDLKMDQEALSLLFEVLDALNVIYTKVRNLESVQVLARDAEFHKYTEAKKQFDKDLRAYERKKIELESEHRNAKTPESRQTVKKTLDALVTQGPPVEPVEPSGTRKQLKCDMIAKYKDMIQFHLQRIYKYIKKSMDIFRNKHPSKRYKTDIYEMKNSKSDSKLTRPVLEASNDEDDEYDSDDSDSSGSDDGDSDSESSE